MNSRCQICTLFHFGMTADEINDMHQKFLKSKKVGRPSPFQIPMELRVQLKTQDEIEASKPRQQMDPLETTKPITKPSSLE